MIKFGSPLYWLVTLVMAAVLLGGNYFYVKLFTQKIEPAARAATEASLDIDIQPGWRGFWKVEPDSLRDYPDSKFGLKTKVFTLFSLMIMLFAVGFILEILLIYILAVRLFRGSA
jgi:hypothetical protein